MHQRLSITLTITTFCASVACGPAADPDRLSTRLPEAAEHLADSNLPAAEASLDPVVESDEASSTEYALSAILFLLNGQQSCPGIGSGLARLRIDFDPSVVLFGSEGFFARHRQDPAMAERFLETQMELATDNSIFQDSSDLETFMAAGRDAVPCLEEAERRLRRAFELAGSPDVQIEIPGGLFHVNEPVVMNGPELRILQAALGLTASSLRITDAFDLNMPTQGPMVSRWTEDPTTHAENVLALEAVADELNTRLLRLEADGADRLEAERAPMEARLEVLKEAITWSRETADGVGQLQLGRISPRALEILEGYVEAMKNALDGPTRVPLAGGEVDLDLSLFFEARFTPMAEPMVVQTYEYPGDPENEVAGYYSASLTLDPAALATFVNQFFSKRVVDVPGPFGSSREVNLSGATPADIEALETLPSLVDPLRSYISRNFESQL